MKNSFKALVENNQTREIDTGKIIKAKENLAKDNDDTPGTQISHNKGKKMRQHEPIKNGG